MADRVLSTAEARRAIQNLQRIINEEDRRSVHRPSLTEFYSVGGHL